MKKLLLLGALLVVGATSFAYNQVESLGIVKQSPDVGNPNETATSFEKSVGLYLVSKGNVVAPAENEYILQITPTKTSETSTDSIVFDFTGLVPGATKVVDGAFKAQIFKGGTGSSDVVELPKDSNGDLMISSTLHVSGVDVGGSAVINLEGAVANPATPTVPVGTLTYTLNAQATDTETYAGTINAEIKVADDAESSTFNDRSAAVVVTVDAGAFKG